jgi:hypothetical protein
VVRRVELDGLRELLTVAVLSVPRSCLALPFGAPETLATYAASSYFFSANSLLPSALRASADMVCRFGLWMLRLV